MQQSQPTITGVGLASLGVTALLLAGVGLGIATLISGALYFAGTGSVTTLATPIAYAAAAIACFFGYRLLAPRVWQRSAAPKSRPFPATVDGSNASLTFADDGIIVGRTVSRSRAPIAVGVAGYLMLATAYFTLGLKLDSLIFLPVYMALPFGWKRTIERVPYSTIAEYAPAPDSDRRFVLRRTNEVDLPLEVELKSFSVERFTREFDERLGIEMQRRAVGVAAPPELPARRPTARWIAAVESAVPWANRAESASLVLLGAASLASAALIGAFVTAGVLPGHPGLVLARLLWFVGVFVGLVARGVAAANSLSSAADEHPDPMRVACVEGKETRGDEGVLAAWMRSHDVLVEISRTHLTTHRWKWDGFSGVVAVGMAIVGAWMIEGGPGPHYVLVYMAPVFALGLPTQRRDRHPIPFDDIESIRRTANRFAVTPAAPDLPQAELHFDYRPGETFAAVLAAVAPEKLSEASETRPRSAAEAAADVDAAAARIEKLREGQSR